MNLQALQRQAEGGDSKAQHQLGMCYLTGQGVAHDPGRGRQWLERAAEGGDVASCRIVGMIYAAGMDVVPDMARAHGYLSRADDAGDADAAWFLGELAAGARDEAYDLERAIDYLRRAAERGSLAAADQIAYCQWQGLGVPRDPEAAARAFIANARRGSGRALLTLAEWYQHGFVVPSNPAKALGLAGAAGQRRYPLAAEVSQEWTRESGVAPAEPVLDDADVGRGAGSLPPTSLEMLSWRPRVIRFNHLFTTSECAHLIERAAIHLMPSQVVTQDGSQGRHQQIRTSWEIRLRPGIRDLVINHLERRMAAWSHFGIEHGELPLVLRYQPGQEFKPHFDYFDTKTFRMGEGPLENGGQRIATQLVYLNSAYAGGETTFPLVDLTIRGRRGDAILFYNVEPDGSLDRLTRHTGDPVTAGEKWLLSRWIRETDAMKPSKTS